MPSTNLKFQTRTGYRGRNGTGYCEGLNIWPTVEGTVVEITPITSKGVRSNACVLQVPASDIPALIEALSAAVKP